MSYANDMSYASNMSYLSFMSDINITSYVKWYELRHNLCKLYMSIFINHWNNFFFHIYGWIWDIKKTSKYIL